MSSQITQLFFSIADSAFPVRTANDAIAFFQNDTFFQLAFQKEKRVKDLVAFFKSKKNFRVIFSYIYRNLSVNSPSIELDYLPEGYFNVQDASDEDQKVANLSGAIVIVNSGDAGLYGNSYARIYNRCTDTIFVVWDQDNHHWLEVSTFIAAHSDAYIPLHVDNLYALSRYNQVIMGPVPSGTIQWTSKFLAGHVDMMLEQQRSNEPLGKHIMYGKFAYRSKVVTTLHNKIPSIDFSTAQFHHRSDEDRFCEWCRHKCHWIVPILNDIPQRLFDAMVTGGIPIVPESLRFLTPVSEIKRDSILFYGAADIFEPEAIVAKATAMFDEGGTEAMLERYHFALEMHHADSRIKHILAYVAERFELAL